MESETQVAPPLLAAEISPDHDDARVSFTPAGASKIPRPWERKPATPFQPRFHDHKIWKRYELRSKTTDGQAARSPTPDNASLRAVKRLRRHVDAGHTPYVVMKYDQTEPSGKRKRKRKQDNSRVSSAKSSNSPKRHILDAINKSPSRNGTPSKGRSPAKGIIPPRLFTPGLGDSPTRNVTLGNRSSPLKEMALPSTTSPTKIWSPSKRKTPGKKTTTSRLLSPHKAESLMPRNGSPLPGLVLFRRSSPDRAMSPNPLAQSPVVTKGVDVGVDELETRESRVLSSPTTGATGDTVSDSTPRISSKALPESHREDTKDGDKNRTVASLRPSQASKISYESLEPQEMAGDEMNNIIPFTECETLHDTDTMSLRDLTSQPPTKPSLMPEKYVPNDHLSPAMSLITPIITAVTAPLRGLSSHREDRTPDDIASDNEREGVIDSIELVTVMEQDVDKASEDTIDHHRTDSAKEADPGQYILCSPEQTTERAETYEPETEISHPVQPTTSPTVVGSISEGQRVAGLVDDDEDTALLKDFLLRAKAKKVAMTASKDTADPETPRKNNRSALSQVDNNNKAHSPFKPQIQIDKMTPASPTKEIEVNHSSTPSTRRSGRTRSSKKRKDLKDGPNSIPVRRTDGTEHIALQKSEAQELASTTRANTKRNKGDAMLPKYKMKELTSREIVAEDTSLDVPKRHGLKEVSWDDKPIYLQQESRQSSQEEGGDENAPPTTRRLRRLGAANGTPAPKRMTMKVPKEASRTPISTRRGKPKAQP